MKGFLKGSYKLFDTSQICILCIFVLYSHFLTKISCYFLWMQIARSLRLGIIQYLFILYLSGIAGARFSLRSLVFLVLLDKSALRESIFQMKGHFVAHFLPILLQKKNFFMATINTDTAMQKKRYNFELLCVLDSSCICMYYNCTRTISW